MKKNSSKILIDGSLVYDRLFDILGNIKDSVTIKNGRAGKQNLMFTAIEKEEFFGGTAGNIAYGLGLLKEKSLLVSVVGRDFLKYKKHLKNQGTELRIYEDEKRMTATFSSMSDQIREQLGIFEPNAYGKHIENLPLTRLLKSSDWKNISIAIFSAGTAKSITNHIEEFRKIRKSSAMIIFDPGQTLLSTFTHTLLEKAFKNSDLVIVNDIELKKIKDFFGYSQEKIFSLGVKSIIETRGAEGSILHEPKKKTLIKAIKVKKVIDATGAGDAYRAGLIHSLISGKKLEEAMLLGSKLGALCVATPGGQTYKI